VVADTVFTGRGILGVVRPGDYTVVDARSFVTSTYAADHFAVNGNAPIWNVIIKLAVGALNIQSE